MPAFSPHPALALILLLPPTIVEQSNGCGPQRRVSYGNEDVPGPSLTTTGSDDSTTVSESTTTEASTTGAPPTGTSTMEVSTTDTSSSGTGLPLCEQDGICNTGEDASNCPADCGCGNGVLDEGEECDLGEKNKDYWPDLLMDTCNTSCKINVLFCGDGEVNGDEQCDAPGQSFTCEVSCRHATCGDGDPNYLAGENCDDGNTDEDDACIDNCMTIQRTVFITSEVYTGNLGGDLNFADARCQARAKFAGLDGSFKAWLSTEMEPAAMRLDSTFIGNYRLTGANENSVIAKSWKDLVSKPLLLPIDLDEGGSPIPAPFTAWTSTLANGAFAPETDCNQWSTLEETGTVGLASAVDATWTNFKVDVCTAGHRLYCFEDLPIGD